MMRKTYILIVAALMCCTLGFAQNCTKSPYSQYGLGDISQLSTAAQRGLAGVGQGWREHNQVSFQNPASYSAIDSLTFIFDAALTGSTTSFKENGNTNSARAANFDYVAAICRLFPHLGLSFGLLPYSNIGYSYSATSGTYDIKRGAMNPNLVNTHTYYGSGGFREAYIGLGYAPVKYISVGFNAGYFWGNYTKTTSTTFGDGSTTSSYYYTATAKTWKLDLGLQAIVPLPEKNQVVLGATYSFGHQLSNDAYCSKKDSILCSFDMPSSLAAGVMWKKGNQWKVGLDYNLMWFGKLSMPLYNDTKGTYTMASGLLKDRHSFKAGLDYCPNDRSRHWLSRVHYRFGAAYTTPYIMVNGADGPKEMNVSVGLGLPIQNGYNNRSVLNIAGQWVHRSAKDMITENTFMLTIGLCFNELWFSKWKAE